MRSNRLSVARSELEQSSQLSSVVQVDPFGVPLTDEQGFPLPTYDPRRVLVEQLVQSMYDGCESLFYSVLSQTNSLNCLLQVQLFDTSGIAQETTICKIGTATNILMECTTFDKLDAFCPENVPVRIKGKPLINIHDVIVSRRWRGQGIARQMLTQVEDIARQRGCCKLTLEVLEGNKAAQRSYRGLGFEGYQLVPEMGRAMFWEKPL